MLLYWLWFAQAEGLTTRQKRSILECYSDPEEIYNVGVTLPEGELDKDLSRAEKILEQCRKKNIKLLPFTDPQYPEKLHSISDPPMLLYYRGKLPDFTRQPAIGVVGTRKASQYGLRQAMDMSQQIAKGAIVVSGGAFGVDSAALNGVVKGGGVPVAVLGCGVDVIYPRTNRQLFSQIVAEGCLISEYPPGTEPKPWQFPERNRIISGMSDGVLVIEAPAKSGALITARDAMEQGRDLFVVPANVDSSSAVGSNQLLREGATAVLEGFDVLREYEGRYPHIGELFSREAAADPAENLSDDKKVIDNLHTNSYSVLDNSILEGLSEQERTVVLCIGREPKYTDVVIREVDLPPTVTLGIITKLALRGVLDLQPGKLVSRK